MTMAARMRISSAQTPQRATSEVKVFTTSNAVVMLDPTEYLQDSSASAADHAAQLGKNICDGLELQSSAELRAVLAHAIAETARNLQLDGNGSTESAVSIVRASGLNIDMLLLGDIPVVLRSGTVHDEGTDTGHRNSHERPNGPRGTTENHHVVGSDPGAAGRAAVVTRSVSKDPWAIIVSDRTGAALNDLEFDDWNRVAGYNNNELSELLNRAESCRPNRTSRPRDSTSPSHPVDKAIAVVRWDV